MPTADGVLRSGVAPGFPFRLADLALRPEPDDMIEDPVYPPFVLPRWQADRQTLAAEHQALAAERQAREQAEQRAQQERAEKERLLAELARLRG
jgi:hypothetical protein